MLAALACCNHYESPQQSAAALGRRRASMTAEFARILALVDTYLANEEFGPLWRPIAGPDADTLKADALSRVEEPLWEELYEIVYMGHDHTATPAERHDGLLGADQLQERLRSWRESARAALSA